MKKVFIQKIPIDYNRVDGFLISPDVAGKFHKMAVDTLQDDYYVVTTPMECKITDDETEILHIEGRSYSLNEIEEIIDKAHKYDNLCE